MKAVDYCLGCDVIGTDGTKFDYGSTINSGISAISQIASAALAANATQAQADAAKAAADATSKATIAQANAAVQAADLARKQKDGFPWWIIGVVAAGFVGISGLGYLIVKSRSR